MTQEKHGTLTGSFIACAPDDAMAPDLAREGHALLFEVGYPVKPGSGVIVKDKTGALYLRQYREGSSPGQWVAHATNANYRNLFSDTDELTIVAVVRAPMRGWEDL